MQKFIVAIMALTIVSCNSDDKKTAEDGKVKEEAASTAPMNMSGYTPTYSASFEMGDPKHAEMVLELWKDFDNGNLAPSKGFFADTMHLYISDGTVIEGPRDSVVASVQGWRDMFSSVKSTVHAVMPVKSKDKNENWVLIWGTEVHTEKSSGKTDSVNLQETWRFKAGKIDLLYQHMRPAGPVAPSK